MTRSECFIRPPVRGLRRSERSEESAFVLVSVLWILAILTVMALGFGRRSMMERKVAWYTLDHAQALQMARGAAERAAAEISNKHVFDLLEEKPNYTGFDQKWARPVNILGEDLFEASKNPDFEAEYCGYRIYDCSGLISINNTHQDILREIDGLSATAMRKILSRRAGGDEGREMRTFLSIEEVKTFAGIDDRDWNGREPGTGLKDILTCWGGWINVNTAPAAVLRYIPDVRPSVIDAIVGYRVGEDGELGTEDDRSFVDMGDLRDKLDLSADATRGLQRFCTTSSEFFRIEAVATRRGGKVVARVTAIVHAGAYSRSIIVWNEDVFRT